MFRVPGQWTTDPDVFPSPEALRILSKASAVGRAAGFAAAKARLKEKAGADPSEYEDEYRIIQEIRKRKESLEPEQTRIRSLFLRMDNLYYPQIVTDPGGADHWPLEKLSQGQTHVSVNNIPAYVEIPANLQAVTPIENYVAEEETDEEKQAAARRERLYFAWKEEDEFELKWKKACLVKELYGYTFGKVKWDGSEKRPSVTVIDRPDNLYVGWGASDYSRFDWTVYCYGLSHQAVREEYDLDVMPIPTGGDVYIPYVTGDHADPIGTLYGSNSLTIPPKMRSTYEQQQIEVYDYWYKKPKGRGKKPEIWNAIYVGNALVENAHHPEFDDIPYVLLPNTFAPGYPIGKPALYDLEQLFREKDERITNAAQMIQSIVGGQMWQLVGPDTEAGAVDSNAVPKPNTVVSPGPSAEIKAIQPFVPQFAIEDYLKRIDKELTEASGLSDVLLGNVPLQALSSSKALRDLVAQYASRISLKRDLAYAWRKRIWRMVAICWERKSRDHKTIIDGKYRISVTAPELTQRDEMENAQKVINLVQNRLMSMRRGMDQVGIEDPEAEVETVKAEQTDPALNPEAVSAQVTLAATLSQFGGQGAQPGQQQGKNPANGPQPAAGSPSLNGPENAANPPPESTPENATAPNGARVQTLVQAGEAQGRVLTSENL
jgi:hypothetical protein